LKFQFIVGTFETSNNFYQRFQVDFNGSPAIPNQVYYYILVAYRQPFNAFTTTWEYSRYISHLTNKACGVVGVLGNSFAGKSVFIKKTFSFVGKTVDTSARDPNMPVDFVPTRVLTNYPDYPIDEQLGITLNFLDTQGVNIYEPALLEKFIHGLPIGTKFSPVSTLPRYWKNVSIYPEHSVDFIWVIIDGTTLVKDGEFDNTTIEQQKQLMITISGLLGGPRYVCVVISKLDKLATKNSEEEVNYRTKFSNYFIPYQVLFQAFRGPIDSEEPDISFLGVVRGTLQQLGHELQK